MAGGSPGSSAKIAEMLHSLGMTHEDLTRHSEQMRQFLTTDPNNPSAFSSQQKPANESPSKKARSRKRPRPPSLSNAARDAHSPSPMSRGTPIKRETSEGTLPSRQMDTMELVMQRLSSKKDKMIRRGSDASPRDSRRVSTPRTPVASSRLMVEPQATPVTPHRYRHYSERVVVDAFASLYPTTPLNDNQTPSAPVASSSQFAFRMPDPRIIAPSTPVGRHIYSSSARTSPRASSPASSPPRVVNLVSSPGPMRATPLEEEEAELPFSLPPGPYPEAKPDLPYAAMIGQAILSSPDHRLTLQDIYEWISTVYPFYKRGEQTWMNSVRHALSTMAVFRKVPRERNEGKSLWAVFDCDLPCFADGGFKKSLCADMVNERAKRAKKRGAPDEATSRRGKRQRKDESGFDDMRPIPAMLPAPVLPPFFPHFHPTSNHQPYYQAYVPPSMPTEVIFPPLPPSSNYHRVAALSAASSSAPSRSQSVDDCILQGDDNDGSDRRGRDRSPKPISSPISIPGLSPNHSSSSSPLPSTSSLPAMSSSPELRPDLDIIEDDIDDSEFVIGSPVIDLLEPGFTLLSRYLGKKTSTRTQLFENAKALPIPGSPTPRSRVSKEKHAASIMTPVTPPRSTLPTRPCTPPRKDAPIASGVHLSPVRTPLSHKGLHMSPSPSLAHYKSHLDPPPVYHSQAPLLSGTFDNDGPGPSTVDASVIRTPSRKRSGPLHADFLLPVTPKRLVFDTPGRDSPFRTPTRSVFDPHDPGTLLDDELNRISTRMDGSPFGLSSIFGRSSGLLYESPGSTLSPARWW